MMAAGAMPYRPGRLDRAFKIPPPRFAFRTFKRRDADRRDCFPFMDALRAASPPRKMRCFGLIAFRYHLGPELDNAHRFTLRLLRGFDVGIPTSGFGPRSIRISGSTSTRAASQHTTRPAFDGRARSRGKRRTGIPTSHRPREAAHSQRRSQFPRTSAEPPPSTSASPFSSFSRPQKIQPTPRWCEG